MLMFKCCQKMDGKRQNDLVNNFSINSTPSFPEEGLLIPTEVVMNCLYERKQLIFVDANEVGKTGVTSGTSNSHTWCLLCRKRFIEQCPSHGLNYASKQRSDNQLSRAVNSLPPEMSLCVSSIPGAGFGVCTRKHIPEGTWIGPFEGKRVQPVDVKPGTDTSFMWEIFEGDKLSYYLDGRDESSSSWMRFIQCARSKDEQNLFAFQYKDKLYYRSFKQIGAREELLVWYDDGYRQHFGIPTGLHDTSFVKHGYQGIGQKRAQKPGRRSFLLAPRQGQQEKHQQWGQHHQQQQRKQQLQQQHQPLLQLPFQTTISLFPRRLSTDSILTDQRSSPVSDVDSDFSDPGNNQVPTARSPIGEMTSWQCQQCSKTFTQRVALQMHVCPCQPAKPYQCGQCSQAFSNPSLLRAHVISHTSEKPFKCGFCSRAFVGATTLNNHIRSHMGQKPFGCDRCGKTFSQPGLLARHTRNPRECKGAPTSLIET